MQNIQANYVIDKFVTLNAKYGFNYENTVQNYLYKNQSQTITGQEGQFSGIYAPDATGELDKNSNNISF